MKKLTKALRAVLAQRWLPYVLLGVLCADDPVKGACYGWLAAQAAGLFRKQG